MNNFEERGWLFNYRREVSHENTYFYHYTFEPETSKESCPQFALAFYVFNTYLRWHSEHDGDAHPYIEFKNKVELMVKCVENYKEILYKLQQGEDLPTTKVKTDLNPLYASGTGDITYYFNGKLEIGDVNKCFIELRSCNRGIRLYNSKRDLDILENMHLVLKKLINNIELSINYFTI